MVSDFIDEHHGFLRLTDDKFKEAKKTNPAIAKEARELLEYGENRDGYWTGEKFMNHVKRAVSSYIQRNSTRCAFCLIMRQLIPEWLLML